MSDFDWEKYEDASSAERYGKDVLIGLSNLGHSTVNLPYNVTKMFDEELANKIPHMQEYDYAALLNQPKKEPIDMFIQGGVEVLPSFAIPGLNMGKLGGLISKIPGVGKYANAAASEAIPQAAYAYGSALDSPEQDALASAELAGGVTGATEVLSEAIRSGNPYLKFAGKAGLGLAGAYAGNELGSLTNIPGGEAAGATAGAILGGRGINLNRNATKAVFEGLNPAEAKEMVEASRRLGLDFITPGEAIQNPYVAAEHAIIGRTREGAKELYSRGLKRVESEESAISKLLDDIYSEGRLSPQKKALYEKAMQSEMPKDIASSLEDSAIIKSAIKTMKSDPAYKDKLLNVSENSFEYWNQVKRALDGMEGSAIRSGDNTKASYIKMKRKELVGIMDEIEPKYKDARSIAERDFTRRELEKHFNKSALTGNRFSKLLDNKDKFNKLVDSLSAFPEVQKTLYDMRKVFPRLQNFNPTNKTTAALQKTGMTTARNTVDAIRDYLQRNNFLKEDVQAVQLMTDPHWFEKLSALSLSKGDVNIASKMNDNKVLMQELMNSKNMDEPLKLQSGNPELAYIIKLLGRGSGQGLSKTTERRDK